MKKNMFLVEFSRKIIRENSTCGANPRFLCLMGRKIHDYRGINP